MELCGISRFNLLLLLLFKKKSKERAKLEIKVDNIPQFVHNETITSACSVNSFLSVTETKPFRTKIVTQV